MRSSLALRPKVKKDLAIIGGLFLVVVVLLVFGQGLSTASFVGLKPAGQMSSQSKGRVSLSAGSLSVKAQVSDTASARKKGLSGHDTLPINEGMLFVFDKSAKWGIWMKNMKFPIDIIWIDDSPVGEKRVVDIAQDAMPEPGQRDAELTVYRPQTDSKYILEINAGLANLNNLKVGDAVSFEL